MNEETGSRQRCHTPETLLEDIRLALPDADRLVYQAVTTDYGPEFEVRAVCGDRTFVRLTRRPKEIEPLRREIAEIASDHACVWVKMYGSHATCNFSISPDRIEIAVVSQSAEATQAVIDPAQGSFAWITGPRGGPVTLCRDARGCETYEEDEFQSVGEAQRAGEQRYGIKPDAWNLSDVVGSRWTHEEVWRKSHPQGLTYPHARAAVLMAYGFVFLDRDGYPIEPFRHGFIPGGFTADTADWFLAKISKSTLAADFHLPALLAERESVEASMEFQTLLRAMSDLVGVSRFYPIKGE